MNVLEFFVGMASPSSQDLAIEAGKKYDDGGCVFEDGKRVRFSYWWMALSQAERFAISARVKVKMARAMMAAMK